MRLVLAAVLAVAVPFAFGGCSSSDKPKECQGCVKAKETNGWCDGCNVGFKDGEKVKCKGCHTAAMAAGGWCDGCGKGYKNGQPTKCKGCAEAAATGGDCAT